jgi:2-haloacid dehalogenase
MVDQAAHGIPVACVFDAYGTLFDVGSVVGRHQARLGDAAQRLSTLWRQKQLEYTWLRSLMGRYADFWTVTREALLCALDACGIRDAKLAEDLLAGYMTPELYPEVRAALGVLHDDGRRLAVLSNGSPAMLEAAVKAARLDDFLEALLSVDAIGVYKPDPRVYRMATQYFAAAPSDLVFVSANAWDIAGASTFGLRAFWVNRTAQQGENLPGAPEAQIPSLAALPQLLLAGAGDSRSRTERSDPTA